MSKLMQLCTIAVLGILTVSIGHAQNPHFVGTPTSDVTNGGALVCSFKAAGFGSGQTVDVTCQAAQATALYACFNRGGNNPSAQNKRQEMGSVIGVEPLTAGRTGQITGSVTAGPLQPTLSCPGNQVLRLCSVSYGGVSLTVEGVGTQVLPSISTTTVNSCPGV
jgi:hypothetical protein